MIKRITSFTLCILMLVGMCISTNISANADAARGPIANNGTNGIYIDILSAPYTTYANKSWGQYAYSTQGCAWFASARACQLTGKDSAIWDGQSWYDGQYASYGYGRGSQIKAKALACYTNHVSVIERVDGNIVTVSEGGVSSSDYYANGHCWITTKTIAQVESGGFLGYVYLGVSANNDPLTTPTIATDKENYSVGDTVKVTWTASSANSVLSHYWIIIGTPSGDTLVNERVNNATSYSFTVSEQGEYKIKVFATPIGSVSGEGSLTDEKTITVMPKAGKATLSVTAGDSVSKTSFVWNTTENTESYKLKIDRMDKTYSKTQEIAKTDTSYFLVLAEGEYEAVLSSISSNGVPTESDKVTFSVLAAEDSDDTWVYIDELPDEIKNGDYEIQYSYTYKTVSKDAPSEAWVKGDFAETAYENSGEAYWSYIELPTSETRELVHYYYYHYCGGSQGNNANFQFTNAYNHYDYIGSNGVYETSSNEDYDDSRYKYYTLNYTSGGAVYCRSGVTCDGSYGSHGERSNYWYRASQYQDKVAVDLYNYYKNGTWTTAEEENYTSVTYRYRKTGSSAGDVNCDGKVNMKDVTVLQTIIAQLTDYSAFGEKSEANADSNHDGRVSMLDVTQIQRYIAKLIPDLNPKN